MTWLVDDPRVRLFVSTSVDSSSFVHRFYRAGKTVPER